MFYIVITLDYELPANGQGDVRRYIIEPTAALIDICQQFSSKLTIMAEMGELWAFENLKNNGFREYLGYDPAIEIRRQLVEATKRGHDVQLHLHPQWINARWVGTGWDLDYKHYRLTDFNQEKMVAVLKRGKKDLEDLLSPHITSYECIGFRAGHWNTQPSDRYLAALSESGFKSDTSVFKWGYANSNSVTYDYRGAQSNVLPWYASQNDINRSSFKKGILEVPISTELTMIFNMLTPKRLWLARNYLQEAYQISLAANKAMGKQEKSQGFLHRLNRLFSLHPKKLDFCKLTSRQMVSMVKNLVNKYEKQQPTLPIPLVMIGHSKQFGTGKGLFKFLEIICEHFGDKVRFSTYHRFIDEYEAATICK